MIFKGSEALMFEIGSGQLSVHYSKVPTQTNRGSGNARPFPTPDVMDRFTIKTQEGELPREYIARRLYSCESYDPNNGKTSTRLIRLATKDVTDHLEQVKVRENKKTGRPEADDDNSNRSREQLWCAALLAVLKPLENVSQEISKATG